MPLVPDKGPDQIFQAMIQMVLYQSFLGVLNSLLNCLQLLRNIETRSARGQHLYRAAQMPTRPSQPLDYGWMRSMHVRLSHS